ncbi:MAG: hypothetical protein K2G23_04535, partial [Muribaculaceae bacterium]|nr:hypothetical protein [Muribaculaceae bacterium]
MIRFKSRFIAWIFIKLILAAKLANNAMKFQIFLCGKSANFTYIPNTLAIFCSSRMAKMCLPVGVRAAP